MMPVPQPTVVTSRRQRLRETTHDEIKSTARSALVAAGPDGISLRAIARAMGMTAPALYRYFGSREELLDELIADFYDEVCSAMERARDAVPLEQTERRLPMVSRAFRRWALEHPREFGLVFGSPLPGYAEPTEGRTAEAHQRFGDIFFGLFVEVWTRRPFPVPADDDLEPRLVEQLAAWLPEDAPLPIGAVAVFLQCWVRLYGAVTTEVFGHLAWALSDGDALFERELVLLGDLLGLAGPVTVPVTGP
jgi:AcrR family transcriptional regulator